MAGDAAPTKASTDTGEAAAREAAWAWARLAVLETLTAGGGWDGSETWRAAAAGAVGGGVVAAVGVGVSEAAAPATVAGSGRTVAGETLAVAAFDVAPMTAAASSSAAAKALRGGEPWVTSELELTAVATAAEGSVGIELGCA
jgi:hypothetical protein